MTTPEVFIVQISRPGMSGTGLTAPEKAQLTSDVAAALSRINVTELDDIPDVDVSGVVDGDTLVYNGTTEEWMPGQSGGSIAFVENLHLDVIGSDVERLQFVGGLEPVLDGSNSRRVFVRVMYAGSGSAATAARSDHRHAQVVPVRVSTAPSGYMSGGSQSLGATSVMLADGIPYVVEAELYGQLRGADAGVANYTLSINIDGNVFTSPGGSDGFWCVQGVPDKIKWKHERKITGAGVGVTVSASVSYHSGSGFYVDRTYLDVRLRPER